MGRASIKLGCLALVAVSFIHTALAQTTSGYARYNPCQPSEPSNKGDPFVIGLAYWPGGTVLQWGGAEPDANGVPGLNPCIGDVSINGSVVNYQQYLNDKKVSFSTYSVTIDTLTALRTTRLEEDLMFAQAKASTTEQVISVIAFRGNIRSEAQYIRSASAITGGQGVVARLGLIVNMDGGVLSALNWYNFDGCNACGGQGSSTCIRTQYDAVYQPQTQESCATPLTDAGCAPCTDTACKQVNCSTTTMVAFRGNTVSGQPLQSAYQMESAFKYSIYDVVGSIFNNAGEDLGTVNAGTTGAGINGGSGNALASPAPLPGGAVSDAALSAAQNGTSLSPPPPSPSPPTVPAVVPPPLAVVGSPPTGATPVVTTPVQPVAPTVPPPPTTTTTVPPSPDYNSPSPDYNSPNPDYISPSPYALG